MKALLNFFQSSLGKKIVMSLSGLFLCLFLIVHLGGNLLLFRDDGGEMFDAYSKVMGSNPLIRTIEVVLFIGLLAHGVSGVIVWLRNRASRQGTYELYRLKDHTPVESRTPMLTASASVVLVFLVIHLNTFWVPERFPVSEHMSPFVRVSTKLSDPFYSGFYLLALIFLMYHLKHGFQSAFQTLGLRNAKYERLLDAVSIIFWLIIPLGFAAMPVYFLLLRYNCIG